MIGRYINGAIAIAAIALLAWGARALYMAGYRAALVKQQTDAALVAAARVDFEVSVARAINNIEVKHVTIRQNLEKEVSHDVVYRDCVATPGVFELSNQALAAPTAHPAADSLVPDAQPAQ